MADIKKLGFGLMRLPKEGDWYDVPQIKDMVDYFMGKGFTFFDTAYVYNGGKSEMVAKEVLVDRYPRESFQLASKLPIWVCKEAADMQKVLDTSLERCGVEYFDYYLLHSLNDGERLETLDKFGAWDFMEKAKAEGKIRNWCFSFHDKADVLDKILTEHPGAAYVQLQINYADWEDDGVQARLNYEVCKKHGVPVVIMEPVKGGSLALLTPNVQKIFLDADPDASFASWAVRFCASLDNVVTVLSGMSTIEQVRDNVDFMDSFKPLTEADYKVIDAALEEMKKIDTIPCTKCGYCVEACPLDIATPSIFGCMNFELLYNDLNNAKRQYTFVNADRRADKCIQCGACEDVCPQHIGIRELLQQAAARLV
ncbi:MAG: 4Fe-4S dicluster domain-containing protein [Ruminococcaceae bacterium]|nr:4Fe-4S dicluster domain-containing protein [Oscillospiraceae bacterium]